MKVKDLLKMDIDIDVYDDVCEELAIAFCGAYDLTDEAKEHFAEALEYDCEIMNGLDGRAEIVIVHADSMKQVRKARELFESLAGYCASDDYDRWFKEVE